MDKTENNTPSNSATFAQKDAIWLHCSNSAVRRASRQLGQLYDDAMGETGLKGTQFSLLTQIFFLGEPTQKELAEHMVMDLSALGHTLKPLVRDGLLEMVPDEKDGRVRRVRLTDIGKDRQSELVARWQVAQDRFDAAFGKEKSQQLRQTLAFISSPEFAQMFQDADID
jgi:DNA-binding MarR family transcriptional regulator